MGVLKCNAHFEDEIACVEAHCKCDDQCFTFTNCHHLCFGVFSDTFENQELAFLFKGWLESSDSKFGKTQVLQFHSHSLTRLVLFSGSVVAQCVEVGKTLKI